MEAFESIIREIRLREANHLEEQHLRTTQLGWHLTLEDVQRWSEITDATPAAIVDLVTLWLARGYLDGTLTFGLCDNVINELWSLVLHNDVMGNMSPLLHAIFLAFDAGEYHHGNQGEDPAEAFTRPLLIEALKHLGQ